MKCLQKDPNKRSTAEELLNAEYLIPTSYPSSSNNPGPGLKLTYFQIVKLSQFAGKVCPSCRSTQKAMTRITNMRSRNNNNSSLLC